MTKAVLFLLCYPFWLCLAENLSQMLHSELCCGPMVQDASTVIRFDINPSCHNDACSPSNSFVSLVNISYEAANVLSNRSVTSIQDMSSLYIPTISTSDDGPDVRRHWLWAAIDRPTIMGLIVPSSNDSDQPLIDWGPLLYPGRSDAAVKFPAQPTFMCALSIDRLIEFDDPLDIGHLNGSAESLQSVVMYDLKNFKWRREIVDRSDDQLVISFVGSESLDVHGEINVTISAFASSGIGIFPPRLGRSRATTQVEIQLKHLHSKSEFQFGRFALQLAMVSQFADSASSPTGRFEVQHAKLVDDEATPGIFDIFDLIAHGPSTNLQSYIEWRPVAYTNQEIYHRRPLATHTTTRPTVSEPVWLANDEDIGQRLNESTIQALFGQSILFDVNTMSVGLINVSFGRHEDNYFRSTNFTAWSFTFGTGQPNHRGLSAVVILVIVALCCLVGLTLIGCGIIHFYHKMQVAQINYMIARSNSPDDDARDTDTVSDEAPLVST